MNCRFRYAGIYLISGMPKTAVRVIRMSSPEREALHGFGRHERGHGLPLSAFRHVGPCRGFHGVAHEVGVDPDVAHGRADAGMAEQLGHQQHVAAGAVVAKVANLRRRLWLGNDVASLMRVPT